MALMTYTVSREIGEGEVEALITGTGMLAYEWWTNVERRDDDSWRVTHYDGGDDQQVKYTDVTESMVADAVGECVRLEYLDPTHSDVQDALTENLGYLDAHGADVLMQWAVFGDLVYG